ncbi:MAG: tetratricopeptide repeat protein [Ignavibacteriae bacterium]|nr:tetratricopeptide repeat protein [Ignavibacteriota bacterium]
MKCKSFYIVLFFFISTLSFAQQSNGEYERLLVEGENLAYEFKFDESRVALLSAIRLNHEKPEAFHQIAKHYLWYYLGSKSISEYYKFISYSDSSLVRAERYNDLNPDNLQTLYLLGNIYKQRSMAFAESQNTMDAFWAARSAVGYYEDVLDIESTYFSAYGGLGIFEYSLSFLPSFLQWTLPVTGLSADQNEGFAKLENAYENGDKDKVEYMFHIAKLYDEYLADYDKAIGILQKLVSMFPENSLFHYQLGLEYLKVRNLNQAEVEFDKVIEINHPKFIQTNAFANFLKGDLYFFQNKFDKALDFYLEFLTTSKTIDYTGIASYRTALCFHFIDDNNNEVFRRYLKLAGNGNLEIEDDAFANEVSQIVLKFSFTGQMENLLKLENMYYAGQYKDVIENSLKKTNSFQDQDMSALASYYLSCALIEENNLVEAKKIAEELSTVDLRRNKWIMPMSFVNLAKIKFKQKDFVRVEQSLIDAEEINDGRKQYLIQSHINGLRRKVKELSVN